MASKHQDKEQESKHEGKARKGNRQRSEVDLLSKLNLK